MAREPGTVSYAERLRAPWWLWLAALAFSVLLSAEMFLGVAGLAASLGWLAFPIVTALALWWWGRLRVAVVGDEFRADDARLPVRFIADVGVLDPAARREALGPRADPYAFVITRPWVPGAVLVLLNDPADATPYWVISSRRPQRLADALRAAQVTQPQAAPDAATPAEVTGSRAAAARDPAESDERA